VRGSGLEARPRNLRVVQETSSPHERSQREESASLAPRTRRTPTSSRRARPFVLLVVGGVGFYILLPSLLSVFGAWRSLAHLDWPFAVLVLACEVASFVCLWELDRITVRMRPWLPVIAAQLTGNAMGRIFPGGRATAAAVSASMLRQAGVDTGEAAAGLGTSTLLQLATTIVLPVLALPAVVGGAQNQPQPRKGCISEWRYSCC
jgi:uncharacterized membrane protein YbhN (UPF0104 family)